MQTKESVTDKYCVLSLLIKPSSALPMYNDVYYVNTIL